MLTRDGRLRLIGHVVHNGQCYVFRSKKGFEYNIIQDSQAQNLALSKELCLFEDIKSKNPNEIIGIIRKNFGKGGDPIPEGRAIAENYNLIAEIPYDVKKELAKIPDHVKPQDVINYSDQRDIDFITIDPDNAGDYDDAVWAKKNPDGSYELRVAIANVAHYIPSQSKLFDYAIQNGNSTYLGNNVYPMLPEKLSNGICSLKEQSNRVVICTTCTINPDGTLNGFKLEPAVIKSRHRLTYKEADYIRFGKNADGDSSDHKGIVAKTVDVQDSISALFELSQILYDARMKRGAFDIDEKEFEFELNAEGTKVLDYSIAHNEVSTGVIEETAIITNEIWGAIAKKLGIPFNYRNHIMNNADKTSGKLQAELNKFNIVIPKKLDGKNIQKIINSVKGKRIEAFVVKTLLTSLQPATYSVENHGHVGLGIKCENNPESRIINTDQRIEQARSKYFKETGSPYGLSFDGDISHSTYVHSTSPIRRGSDFVNQSQMLSIIMNNRVLFNNQQIEDMSISFNYNEKNSKMAEIDYNDMLFALWAGENIGLRIDNCFISELGEKQAIIMSDKGLKFIMPYTMIDFDKKYLKIGKEFKSVTISKASLYPPKIIVSPTPVNQIYTTRTLAKEM